MTPVGVALIVGGITTLIVFRRFLFGAGSEHGDQQDFVRPEPRARREERRPLGNHPLARQLVPPLVPRVLWQLRNCPPRLWKFLGRFATLIHSGFLIGSRLFPED